MPRQKGPRPKEFRAISIRQPWAHAVLHRGNDVENRSWYTHFRGRILIHTGLGIDRNEDAVKLKIDPTALPRGEIVGDVKIFCCIDNSRRRWANHKAVALVSQKPAPLEDTDPFQGKALLHAGSRDASARQAILQAVTERSWH